MHFRTFLVNQPMMARIDCFCRVFASKTAVAESFAKFHVWGLSAVFFLRCQFPFLLLLMSDYTSVNVLFTFQLLILHPLFTLSSVHVWRCNQARRCPVQTCERCCWYSATRNCHNNKRPLYGRALCIQTFGFTTVPIFGNKLRSHMSLLVRKL